MRLKLNIDNNTNDFKLSKPQLVGIFRSDKSPVSNDANELYLKYVPKPFTRALELEKGFKMQHLKKFAINNKYEALLEWITLNRQLIQQQFNREEQFNNKLILKNDPNLAIPVDFVLTTGSLSYLLKVPYEETAFTILAERFNGTIYIKIKKKTQKYVNDYDLNNYCDQKFKEHYTEKINKDENDFGESKLNQWVSFGKKEEDKKNNKINEKITFVFSTKIKKHSILFSDEVDCFEEVNPLNPDEFGIVKFKLCKKMSNERNDYFNALRKLRWWSTSVFSSVRKLVVGFWSNNHIVEEVKEFSLDDLKYPIFWNSNVCFNNLNLILSLIKQAFNQFNTNTICVVHDKNSKELVCVHSNFKVLPSFYQENFKKSLI